MRLATYNVDSLFERPRLMDQDFSNSDDRWKDAEQKLGDFAALNATLAKSTYAPEDKKSILDLLGKLELLKSDSNELVVLRQNRGHLLQRHRNGAVDVVANGRDDWLGWAPQM